jgi:hypothetical protein
MAVPDVPTALPAAAPDVGFVESTNFCSADDADAEAPAALAEADAAGAF